MKRYRVPSVFWLDHFDRKPVDGDPGLQLARLVRPGRRYTIIEGTPDQIEALRSDAAFYCHADGPGSDDPAMRGLRSSAAATLRALSVTPRYTCCGLFFDAALGKYGCPNCEGENPAKII